MQQRELVADVHDTGKFSSVRAAVSWLISGCANSLRFASRSALLCALDWYCLVSQFRLLLLTFVVRDTSSTPEITSSWNVSYCAGGACNVSFPQDLPNDSEEFVNISAPPQQCETARLTHTKD